MPEKEIKFPDGSTIKTDKRGYTPHEIPVKPPETDKNKKDK
jgi:hypothetical protein